VVANGYFPALAGQVKGVFAQILHLFGLVEWQCVQQSLGEAIAVYHV